MSVLDHKRKRRKKTRVCSGVDIPYLMPRKWTSTANATHLSKLLVADFFVEFHLAFVEPQLNPSDL